MFPLNVIFFTAVSAIQWQAASEHTLYRFFVLAAAAYLLSALARLSILPPSGFPAECSALDRATRGGYEGAITLAATFAAVAIALKLSGLNLAVALMAEAELLFLAGLAFRQRLLRHLATALFVRRQRSAPRGSPGQVRDHRGRPVAFLVARSLARSRGFLSEPVCLKAWRVLQQLRPPCFCW